MNTFVRARLDRRTNVRINIKDEKNWGKKLAAKKRAIYRFPVGLTCPRKKMFITEHFDHFIKKQRKRKNGGKCHFLNSRSGVPVQLWFGVEVSI
jgi:hypothetical protein